jgi:hypothetical protein
MSQEKDSADVIAAENAQSALTELLHSRNEGIGKSLCIYMPILCCI